MAIVGVLVNGDSVLIEETDCVRSMTLEQFKKHARDGEFLAAVQSKARGADKARLAQAVQSVDEGA